LYLIFLFLIDLKCHLRSPPHIVKYFFLYFQHYFHVDEQLLSVNELVVMDIPMHHVRNFGFLGSLNKTSVMSVLHGLGKPLPYMAANLLCPTGSSMPSMSPNFLRSAYP